MTALYPPQATIPGRPYTNKQRTVVKNWLWLVGALALPLQWLILHFSGVHLAPHWEVLSSGVSIFGAAFLLSWGAELAQMDIPQALALACQQQANEAHAVE